MKVKETWDRDTLYDVTVIIAGAEDSTDEDGSVYPVTKILHGDFEADGLRNLIAAFKNETVHASLLGEDESED